MKLYHDLAEYYFTIEKCHRNITDDINLISELASNIKNPALLDLGCGTGEHLGELSKKGFVCTGIDNSKSMLTYAKLRFPNAANFLLSDITSFDFFEDFDVIISLFGSFDYMIVDEDVDKVLWNTWQALKNNGFCLFEIWNAIPVREIKEKPLTTVSRVHYKNLIIERQRGFTLMPDNSKTIAEVNYLYTISDGTTIQHITDKHVMRAFFKEEIEGFLMANGFKIVNIFANSKKEPFIKTSNKLLIHFIKN
ncbi:MAG: class I SAM-dependent methyltransferase [Spirochaetes bacterium]|nr:class I SAM-dependent methyltransferase [Spirochaetota bacterium]